MNQAKVLLVGWDAADWKIINRLMDGGKMPHVKRLVENGVMGNLSTLFPALSPMLWTSIATGKRPHKHGIYGFSEPTPDGKGVQPMTIASRKCKAVWNILNQHDMKSVVVGWWPSHPAEPINGVMVSDFYCKAPRQPGAPWNLMKKSIHPESLHDELNELRCHPDDLRPDDMLPFVPHGDEIDQTADQRISMIIRTLCESTSIQTAATHLLSTQPWDFAAIYFDAIDHFSHGFMRYYPPRQAHVTEQDFRLFKDVVATGYIYHDMMLGRLLQIAGDDVTVILMSDHGFHPDHLRPKELPTEPAGPAVEHRDYGIFVACGPGIKQDQLIHGAGLLDITPTILTIYGLPIGDDMDGKPLIDIFQNKPRVESIPSWETVVGNDGQHPQNFELDPVDSQEAMEQLIALGYIERPDQDVERAVTDCVRELDYNLARAYMDAEMHGAAADILLKLYQQNPLEFRFGIQLANCLKAVEQVADLELLVNDLSQRWKMATAVAKQRLKRLPELSQERNEHWLELKKIDDANPDDTLKRPRLARINMDGTPALFNEDESRAIRRYKAIARGNPQTFDFLAATVALSNGNFELALEKLEKAKAQMAANPSFHYQLGNVFHALGRLEEAEEAFLKALEFDELHARSLMGLCRTWASLGQYKKALDVGQQAIGLIFHAPTAHYFVANAKYALGNIDGAIESYKTALKQNPNFIEVHQKLEEIYSSSSDTRQLAKEHRAAIKQLENEQSKLAEDFEPLDFGTVDSGDFEALMPEIDSVSRGGLLKCLAEPRPVSENKEEKDPSSNEDRSEIFVVSGLPRSGTSMCMQMLVSGGAKAYTDGERVADDNNPKGYFESERVKRLGKANDWLGESCGKVLKVVTPLIPFLPQGFRYRVIMMERKIDEIVESQEKMLARLQRTGGNLDKQRMGEFMENNQQFAENTLKLHGIPVLKISYTDAIEDPAGVAARLKEFLPIDLNANEMAAAIDSSLYRTKATTETA